VTVLSANLTLDNPRFAGEILHIVGCNQKSLILLEEKVNLFIKRIPNEIKFEWSLLRPTMLKPAFEIFMLTGFFCLPNQNLQNLQV